MAEPIRSEIESKKPTPADHGDKRRARSLPAAVGNRLRSAWQACSAARQRSRRKLAPAADWRLAQPQALLIER